MKFLFFDEKVGVKVDSLIGERKLEKVGEFGGASVFIDPTLPKGTMVLVSTKPTVVKNIEAPDALEP